MSKYLAAPHPFVLELPSGPPAGPAAREELGINLFGRGNDYLAFVVRALQQGAASGLRPENVPLRLTMVTQEHPLGSTAWHAIFDGRESMTPLGAGPAQWPAAFQKARLVFRTPLRLRRNDDLVTPDSFEFRDLFSSLLRRLSLVTYFHGDQPLETGFADLIRKAGDISLTNRALYWRDWTRYSSRQKATMQMGGLVGSVICDLSPHNELWPYLWLGQWVHAGKGTSMGLGRFEVGPA